MALTNCPECGRENVSNEAASCPYCGYAVRDYFEKEKRKRQIAEELRKADEKQEEERRKAKAKQEEEHKRLEIELNKRLAEIDKLQTRDRPEISQYVKSQFYENGKITSLSWILIITAIVIIFLLVCRASSSEMLAESSSLILTILSLICIPCLILFGGVSFIDIRDSYQEEYDDWVLQTEDWERYKRNKKEEIRKEYDKKFVTRFTVSSVKNTTTYTQPMQKNNQLKCPVCESTDVKRISTLNRTVSVVAVGLASSKIGKQYECNKCKHKW